MSFDLKNYILSNQDLLKESYGYDDFDECFDSARFVIGKISFRLSGFGDKNEYMLICNFLHIHEQLFFIPKEDIKNWEDFYKIMKAISYIKLSDE